MPTKKGILTPQEQMFVKSLAQHGDAKTAAKEAGYSHPAQRANDMMNRPAIQAEMVKIQLERLSNHLLPLAVNAIERLLVDTRTPAGAVVQAAKLVMDRTLGQDAAEGKQPHEMTGDELARALDRLRREASERAKPIIEGKAETVESPSVFD